MLQIADDLADQPRPPLGMLRQLDRDLLSFCKGLDRAEEEITQAKRPPNETALRDQGIDQCRSQYHQPDQRETVPAPDPFLNSAKAN